MRSDDAERADELSLAAALQVVDPGHGDPEYWDRLHAKTLERSSLELARRRVLAEPTLAGVLSDWSRPLIPLALAAAATAAIVLGLEVRGRAVSDAPVALEEALWDDVADGLLATVMAGEVDDNPVAFMALLERGGR